MARGYPDFEGGKAGLFSSAEWAAYEGHEVTLQSLGTNKAFGTQISRQYNVPADRTLLVTHGTFSCAASSVADADNNQFVYLEIFSPDVLTRLIRLGGNGGGFFYLARPIIVRTGVNIFVFLTAYANHDVNMAFTVGGYELY